MELASYTFKVKGVNNEAREPLLIMPIGDIQWSGQRGDTTLEMLKRHIGWGMEHKAWFIGMGDYIDFLSPSNRQRLSAAALYDSAADVIDDKAMELTEEIYREALKPTKGRWLGMLEGHHFTQLKSGMTTDMRLCQMLDAKFLGTSAMIRLVFKGSGKTGNVTIWAHHGVGGGMATTSAALNKLTRMATHFRADIFLMGHITKQTVEPQDVVEAVWSGRGEPHLIHRVRLLAVTGGFSKGYQVRRKDGIVPRGNYVEQGMMAPAALGGIKVRIVPKWGRQGQSHSEAKHWLPEMSVEI